MCGGIPASKREQRDFRANNQGKTQIVSHGGGHRAIGDIGKHGLARAIPRGADHGQCTAKTPRLAARQSAAKSQAQGATHKSWAHMMRISSPEQVVIGDAELWHGECREVLPLQRLEKTAWFRSVLGDA